MSDRIELNPGDVFAGYTIERLLGVGGMGAVYCARDPELPRRVALKLLHRDLTANDYVRSRFELEAAHAAHLEHPNVVTVYRRGRQGDQLWIAMQYIDTTDADAAVQSGSLPPDYAVHIITETARALDYAHSASVLHRDVKPANILLERSGPGRPGRVLLADFGIAKALAETAQLTQTGMLVASLQYASPEQFDNVDLDARADVYSLGCTLYHLLTGRVPYPGSTLPQLWAGHVKAPIPKASEARPGLPHAFDKVIEQAMAKERGDRYSSCGELAAAAQAALRGTPPPPPPEPDRRSAPTVLDPVSKSDAPTQVDHQQQLRNFVATESEMPALKAAGELEKISRFLTRAGLIVLIALVGASLFTWWRAGSYTAYYDGRTHYYLAYQPLWLAINTTGYTYAQVVVGVLIGVGVLVLLAALLLESRRGASASRLAPVGATLLVFGLLMLTLAIQSGATATSKKKIMLYVALVGAVLLLAGCWRGLSPSLRTVVRLVVPGVAIIALVGMAHIPTLRDPPMPVLGEGGGGLIAGIALTLAGAVVAARRVKLRA